MALFDGMNNPWAPGGQMSPWMPWAQPGLNYGWGHGNEFFTPKTKEQIRDEGLLQMAVLAAILVAPALVGAAGGAGAASGASAAGAGAAGASAEAAGAALAQGAGAAAGAAGAGAGLSAATWASIAGGAATAAILRPFLQPDSSQALLQAARMGEVELNRELQRRSKEDCNCPPKPRFATEEWERMYGDCECGEERQINAGSKVLSSLVDVIKADSNLENQLRRIPSREFQHVDNQLIGQLSKQVLMIIAEQSNSWIQPDRLSSTNEQSYSDAGDCGICGCQWTDLFQFKVSQIAQERIRSLELKVKQFNNSTSTFPPATGSVSPVTIQSATSWQIQDLEFGAGTDVNRDLYQVVVEKLPTIHGEEVSPSQLFQYWKQNFNDFLDHSVANFEGYWEEEQTKFVSSNPIGTLMKFDMLTTFGFYGNVFGLYSNIDDGTVIVSDANDQSWTFTTVKSPNDGIHPVSGHRRFGYVQNPDGTYTFYIKAVDRLSTIVEKVNWWLVFQAAHGLWQGWQASFVKKIEEFGGKAHKVMPISNRDLSWSDARKSCRQ